MKKLMFYLFAVFMFAGCSTSEMALKNDKGIFFSFTAEQTIIENKNFNLKSIDIVQKKLEDDNKRVLFYEDVSTWDGYEFRTNTLNNIVYIFNAKGASVLYNDNTTLLVQIELITNRFLNVMAYSNDSEHLSYIYGLSNYEFKKIAKEFADNVDLTSLKRQGAGLDKDDMPFTRWSETKLIVNPFTILSNGRTVF